MTFCFFISFRAISLSAFSLFGFSLFGFTLFGVTMLVFCAFCQRLFIERFSNAVHDIASSVTGFSEKIYPFLQ